MKTRHIIPILFFLLTSCTSQNRPLHSINANEEQRNEARPMTKARSEIIPGWIKQKSKDCICAQIWMPVCGEDGKTYSNSCTAKCAGVKFTQGACAESDSKKDL